MQLTSFVTDLKRILPPEDYPYVITGLRQDLLVWSALSQPDFFKQALDFAGEHAELWNPSSLALLALGKALPVETLRSLPLIPISSDLRQQAARQYEETYRSATPPATLGEAGLLALALRERRRLTDSWQGLQSELQLNTTANASLSLNIWRTPLACLFGICPDPVDLLKALIPANNQVDNPNQVALLVHALLSNPLPPMEQARILTEVVSGCLPERQVAWLEWLGEQGRKELASQVASSLLKTKGIASLISLSKTIQNKNRNSALSESEVDPLIHHDSLPLVASSRHLARIYQLAGQPAEALPILTSAQKSLTGLQAALSARIAETADQIGDIETSISAHQAAVNLLPESALARSKLASALMKAGKIDESLSVLPENSSHPRVKLISAKGAFKTGDVPRSQNYIRQVMDEFIKSSTGLTPSITRYTRDDLVDLTGLLLDLKMAPEAVDMASRALEFFPEDLDLLELRSRAQKERGSLENAAQDAHLAVALSPEKAEYHRLLADILASGGEWDRSLAERIQVAQHSVEPQTADLIAIASTAIKARQPEKAVEACNTILTNHPDNGLAHAHLGEALALQGDPLGAIQHFTQATLLAPEESTPWLALAKTYETSGDHRKSFDTLKAASLASPLSAEIHLALGQACLADGSPTEALPALRRAASLDPQTAEISMRLGETLLDLGRLNEARQVLERARQTWPALPEMAFLHAKTLLSLGENQEAIAALKVVIDSQPSCVEPYLLFGRTIVEFIQATNGQGQSDQLLLSQGVGLQDARIALEKALSIEPENFEVKVLKAETQAAGGLLGDAMESYLRIVETPQAKEPTWSWRINLGLGRVAGALKQMDTAIAALQEAALLKPDDIQVQRSLAEAYLLANLSDEAMQKARIALHLAPHDIQNLQWYARLSLALRNNAEAIQALTTAAEEAPHHADLVIELSQVHAQTGDTVAARESLKSILNLPQAQPEELQKSARLFTHLDDPGSAIACLEKAIARSSAQPSPELWAELSVLQERSGNPSASLEAIQKSVELSQNNPKYFILQGDLLYGQNRNQEALACFEHALELLDMSKGFVDATQQGFNGTTKTTDASETQLSRWKVNLRVASLQRLTGNLPEALIHAEEAVAESCYQLEPAIAAADLAQAMLNYDRAEKVIAQAISGFSSELKTSDLAVPAGDTLRYVKLLCIQSEIQMETGDYTGAEQVLDQAKTISATNPRVLADLSRLVAHKGEFKIGAQLLEQAIAQLDKTETSELVDRQPKPANIDPNLSLASWVDRPSNLSSNYPTLPVAEAALALHQWEVALPLFYQAARVASNEPHTQFSLARALVLAAENQYGYAMLHALKHAPGAERTNEVAYQQFQKAILAAERMSNFGEIAQWRRRGEAIFNPGPQTARVLVEGMSGPQDVAAQVRALTIMRETTTAAEVAEGSDAGDDLSVLFQKSLAQMEGRPHEAYQSARKVVDLQPENPINQALLAYAAQAAGSSEEALKAIEQALVTWSNEPEWHALAAQIAASKGELQVAIEHWKKASHLDPECPDYPCEMGKVYASLGDVNQAIHSLEQATSLDPDRLEPWTVLAGVYASNQNYPQAIQCAERAIALAPNEIAPVVLSGEIALQSGQLDLAVERAQAALTINPSDTTAVLLNVHSLLAQNHPEEALQFIETSLPVMGEAFPVLLERARLVRQLQGNQAALQTLQVLVDHHPQEPEALAMLAEVQAEAGQKEAAVKNAQSALLIQPQMAGLHLLVGRIQRSSGQLDQAIHHLSEAIRLSPEDVEAYLELGKAHQERREYVQAIKIYQQGTKLAPKDARLYYQTGLAYKDSKDYPSAETNLRRAANLAPEDVNIRRQLGAIIALNLVHHQQEASIQS